MNLPTGTREIFLKMHLLYKELSVGDDDQRRVLIRRIGEQMAFRFGTQWGNKVRAGLGDELRSKDSLAYFHPETGNCDVWDTQSGTTKEVIIFDGDRPTYPNLPPSEARFMPCTPVDWLGNGLPWPEPEPEPTPTPGIDLKPLMDKVDEVLARQMELLQQDTAIRVQLATVNDKLNQVLRQQEARLVVDLNLGRFLGNVRGFATPEFMIKG